MTERRPIRSFVLRQGRVSNAQRQALEKLMPEYGISLGTGLLDLEHIFGRSAPVFLEIGFGMGETTAAIAQAHPQNDYLAVEVHTPGVGSLLKQIKELGLTNIRVLQHDVVELFRQGLPPECLAGVHIFFSRSLAQGAPPQTPPAATGVRGLAVPASEVGRLYSCGHRLAGLCPADTVGFFR